MTRIDDRDMLLLPDTRPAVAPAAASIEEGEERMDRKGSLGVMLCIVLGLAALSPASATAADDTAVVSAQGFVPVAIWEVRREGFPTVRHAWVAGSDAMLRVSWDNGATWYGFRPVFTDTARGLLALKAATREELGRGEVGWRETAGVSLATGQEARVAFESAGGDATIEVTLELLEVTDVSPSELKAGPPSRDVAAEGDLVVPMAGGGGGLGSCCVSCNGVLACDCSVCIAACHASCCKAGCFCLTC
jgi:hypothetical protein